MSLADDRCAMALCLDDSPWQQMPEMAACRHAERAGIEAGLFVVEAFHHHQARRWSGVRSGAAFAHLRASIAAAALRADIVEAMR